MSAPSAVPKLQQHWDARAATNFIAGGAGSGLLVWLAGAQFMIGDVRVLVLAGMVLIAIGLTAVWAEIGRPWRAPFVFRHLTSSWMSREAAVAPFLLALGALCLVWPSTIAVAVTGVLAAAFLYCQARMLNSGKGIPAWRHPRCVPLLVVAGLTEGLGVLAGAAVLVAPGACVVLAYGLLAMLIVRSLVWRGYLTGIERDRAAVRALEALRRIDLRFLILGNALPAALALAAVLGAPGGPSWLIAAGLLGAGCGWRMKYALVRRAAYSQGLAIGRLPVRGGGRPGRQGCGADKALLSVQRGKVPV